MNDNERFGQRRSSLSLANGDREQPRAGRAGNAAEQAVNAHTLHLPEDRGFARWTVAAVVIMIRWCILIAVQPNASPAAKAANDELTLDKGASAMLADYLAEQTDTSREDS